MEVKKSPKANLEKYRLIFFEVGLVLVFMVLWGSFEWKTNSVDLSDLEGEIAPPTEAEEAPVTLQEDTPPPPPPPEAPKPQIQTEFEIKETEEEIETEFEAQETDVTEDTQIEMVEMIEEEEVAEPQIFVVVEEMPEFPGGQIALRTHIAKSIVYPDIAREMDIQGRVFVEFVVDENGKVIKAKVLRSVHPALDKEALRVINSLPKWKPGKQRGKPARVKFTLPINFMLSK